MIHIVTSSRYRIHKKALITFTGTLMRNFLVPEDATLNIAFVGKRKMREIAKTYKHEDVALPVLAFPYNGEAVENEKIFGEIVMCYPQVVLLAAERGKTLDVMTHQLIEHGLKNLLK